MTSNFYVLNFDLGGVSQKMAQTQYSVELKSLTLWGLGSILGLCGTTSIRVQPFVSLLSLIVEARNLHLLFSISSCCTGIVRVSSLGFM